MVFLFSDLWILTEGRSITAFTIARPFSNRQTASMIAVQPMRQKLNAGPNCQLSPQFYRWRENK
jgi:hypothetical protein